MAGGALYASNIKSHAVIQMFRMTAGCKRRGRTNAENGPAVSSVNTMAGAACAGSSITPRGGSVGWWPGTAITLTG